MKLIVICLVVITSFVVFEVNGNCHCFKRGGRRVCNCGRSIIDEDNNMHSGDAHGENSVETIVDNADFNSAGRGFPVAGKRDVIGRKMTLDDEDRSFSKDVDKKFVRAEGKRDDRRDVDAKIGNKLTSEEEARSLNEDLDSRYMRAQDKRNVVGVADINMGRKMILDDEDRFLSDELDKGVMGDEDVPSIINENEKDLHFL